MPKVEIDVDKINRDLLPLTTKTINQLSTVCNLASRVRYPSDDFGWSKVVGGLKDCNNSISIFNTWMQNTNANLNKSLQEEMEELQSIVIDPVSPKQ